MRRFSALLTGSGRFFHQVPSNVAPNVVTQSSEISKPRPPELLAQILPKWPKHPHASTSIPELVKCLDEQTNEALSTHHGGLLNFARSNPSFFHVKKEGGVSQIALSGMSQSLCGKLMYRQKMLEQGVDILQPKPRASPMRPSSRGSGGGGRPSSRGFGQRGRGGFGQGRGGRGGSFRGRGRGNGTGRY